MAILLPIDDVPIKASIFMGPSITSFFFFTEGYIGSRENHPDKNGPKVGSRLSSMQARAPKILRSGALEVA